MIVMVIDLDKYWWRYTDKEVNTCILSVPDEGYSRIGSCVLKLDTYVFIVINKKNLDGRLHYFL